MDYIEQEPNNNTPIVINDNSKLLNNNVNNNDTYNEITELKKKVFLKLINKILVNNGFPEITKLTDFINIEKEQIIKESVIQIINNMNEELYMVFKKTIASYKRDAKKFSLNCLKSFAKQCNMKLVSNKKYMTVVIDDISYKRILYTYSLIPL